MSFQALNTVFHFPRNQVYAVLNSFLCEVALSVEHTGMLTQGAAACRDICSLCESCKIVLQVAGQRYAKSSFTYHAEDNEGF